MNDLTNYAIEANIGFVFFYGIYYLLLRNETDFRKQRLFLLSGLMCSVAFPFIEISWRAPVPMIGDAIGVVVLPELIVGSKPKESFDIFLVVYIVVAMIIAVPLLLQITRLYRLYRKGRYHNTFLIIESNQNKPSWSFFKLIFIGQADQLNSEEKDLIIKHEMLHGRLKHSFDILFITILCLLCWFNPILWLYRRTLARVHEFEVDAIVTRESNNNDYGILLAKTALTGSGLLLTHHFNQSFILKRINMLNIIKSKVSNWKLTALATTIVVYFIAVACTEQVSENKVPLETAGTPTTVAENFAKMQSQFPARELQLIEVTDPKGFYKLDPVEGRRIMHMYAFPEIAKVWVVTGKIDTNVEVFSIVDETAQPVGGITKFYEHLSSKLAYPEQARKMGIEGQVFVEFTVLEDGLLTDFNVLRGVGAGCDAEAMKALVQMEPWLPGKMNGQAVAQKMVLPITFKLE